MSDILRLIAGGLLALCCCYIGVIIKRHYSEREKFYKTATDFTTMLSSELSFKKTPFPKVVEMFSAGKKGVFITVINDYLKKRQSNFEFEKLLKETDMPHIKTDEKRNLLIFFEELGKTSLDDQLSTVSRAGKEFELKQKKCADESKRLGGMYFKLLVLIGIALIVILA